MSKPALLLSKGTQIVTRVAVRADDGREMKPPGAMGVIVQSPGDHWHAYRVRFADGTEVSLKREQMAVLSEFQLAGLAQHPLHEYDLFHSVILKCIVGSRAYGLDDADSDTDLRGVYLPPAAMHWSLYGVPEQIENTKNEELYWELQKFLMMALKANPNILECLYTPLVLEATELGHELIAMRSAFLSKLVYQTYNGYVMSQFRKLQADLRNKGKVKQKHVMHLIRLLLSGIGALREGVVPVQVEAHRDRLLAIRRGEMPFDEASAWRESLHAEFDRAFAQTALPDRPDYARANEFLLKARRWAASES